MPMKFEDCIRSAQRQKELSKEEADDLIERYERYRSGHAAAGAPDPESAAKTSLAGDFDADAVKKRAIAASTARATAESRAFAETYRPIGSDKPDIYEAFLNQLESMAGGTTSWKFRAIAWDGQFQSIMTEHISAFHRKFFSVTGKRADLPKIKNAGREIYGEATGDAPAKNLGESMSLAFEQSRQAWNRAAGYEAIGKIESGYLPQSFKAARMLAVEGKTWAEKYKVIRDDVMAELDMEKTKDPLTKQPLKNSSPERIENIMRAALENAITDGWKSKDPKAVRQGNGALAGSRSDHRFFYYKTFDGWDRLNAKYGGGDVVATVFDHFRGMAKDIAAMETMGANPRAWLEWAKQSLISESKKALIGEPSLTAGKVDTETGTKQAARLEAVFNSIAGPQVISSKIANGFADVSNFLTATYLGATGTLSAVTDPFISSGARYLNGLPHMSAFMNILHSMRQSQTIEQMVRSGIGLDDLLHAAGDEARYAGTMGGHNWSKVMADRMTRWNGLQALTQSGKHQFAKEWQGMAADHIADNWDQLGKNNRYFRDAMQNYGFTPKDWDKLRATDPYVPKKGSAGFLQPTDVADRDLGIRYAAMILGETERAVPNQSDRIKSLVTANIQRGTITGELIYSGLQFKNFPMSFMNGQMQAIQIEANRGGRGLGASYAASMFIALTLGGAAAVQLGNLTNLKDFQPTDPSTGQGFKFWLQSLFKGGGLGLLGDFLFQDMTRFGATPAEQLSGPTITLISDMTALTWGNIQKAMIEKPSEKDPHRIKRISRQAIHTLGRNVPFVSTLPYTRGAYQRLVLDKLQEMSDPEAYTHFNEQAKRLKEQTGQEYFWPPGQAQPLRAPRMSTAQH